MLDLIYINSNGQSSMHASCGSYLFNTVILTTEQNTAVAFQSYS